MFAPRKPYRSTPGTCFFRVSSSAFSRRVFRFDALCTFRISARLLYGAHAFDRDGSSNRRGGYGDESDSADHVSHRRVIDAPPQSAPGAQASTTATAAARARTTSTTTWVWHWHHGSKCNSQLDSSGSDDARTAISTAARIHGGGLSSRRLVVVRIHTASEHFRSNSSIS